MKLAFVGDAPHWSEKTPFSTGPDARMFNSMLRRANIDRRECLVTNVFNEPLPDGEIDAWCVSAKEATALGARELPPIGDRGFLRPEKLGHLERLRRELQEARPCVTVPLGGVALWAMTGSANVGAVRGTVLAANGTFGSVKLLPTYHPSFVRKQFKYYTVVSGDFQKAVEEANAGATIRVPIRALILQPTLEDLDAYRDELLRSSLLSVDIETAYGQITCVGFAASPEFAISVPFVDFRNPSRSYWPDTRTEAAAWKFVRTILASPVPKVGQNFGGYDFYWLLEKYHLQSRNMKEDTRLIYHALYPELPKSLEFMQAHSRQGAWKYMGKHDAKRDD